MIADSVSASIVLFNSPVVEILELARQLIAQGVTKVYIVDNSDAGFDMLEDHVLPGECEYVRSSENLGYGRGHNVALERARETFEYHVVCNPDVFLGTDTIGLLRKFMAANKGVGISMPKLLNVDGSVQYCCRRSPVLWDYLSQIVFPRAGARRRWRLEMHDYDYDRQMDVPCLSGCFMFGRMSVLHAVGGFDPSFFLYFEDFDLSMRARRISRTTYVPAAAIVHERRSGHRSSWRLKWLFISSAVRYFSRWGFFVTRVIPRIAR